MNENNIWACLKCNQSFDRKYNYDRHINSKNKCDSFLTIKENKENMCEYCNTLYERKYHLQRHLNSTKSKCYKQRNNFCGINKEEKNIIQNIINNNYTNCNNTYNYNNNNINNTVNATVNHITQNIIQPIITIAKHGEETISHITKDVMLEILDIESFPKMCTELMRVLYFNKEVPENQNWAIVYPKNKNAGIEFNHTSGKFERKSTTNIIDDKFSNMVSLLFDLVQEISRDDESEHHLSQRQKININKYGMHFGQLDISKTSKEVYKSIHEFAFNARKQQMEVWKENGHQGNHLSLKF